MMGVPLEQVKNNAMADDGGTVRQVCMRVPFFLHPVSYNLPSEIFLLLIIVFSYLKCKFTKNNTKII